METQFPSKYELFGRVIDGQSLHVRELIQYGIAMLAVEDGRAELVERHVIDAREHLIFRTIVGEVFTLIKQIGRTWVWF